MSAVDVRIHVLTEVDSVHRAFATGDKHLQVTHCVRLDRFNVVAARL